MIGDVARVLAGTGTTVMGCRKWASPAGAWCDEAVTGVMAHHAALPFDEMPVFLEALQGRNGMAARALEFTALTAARTGEALGARWGEIDLGAKVWTVPAARMKAGREHRVPLPAR
jgi:integrase